MQTPDADYVEALEKEVLDLTILISASEGWADGYARTPVEFKQLLVQEAQFEAIMRHYFINLSRRVAGYVDWNQYTAAILQAADVSTMVNSDSFNQTEQNQLETIINEIYINGVAVGMQAAFARAKAAGQLTETTITPGSPIDEAVQHVVETEVGNLAKGLDDTTIQAIKNSISESLMRGETRQQATDRLMQNIDGMSNYRATMIARTEIVRAHQMGRHQFAVANGAVTKTWNALPGADEGSSQTPCQDDDGQTVSLSEDFRSGDPYPPAHPNCRCDVDYQYQKPDASVEDVGDDLNGLDVNVTPAEIM